MTLARSRTVVAFIATLAAAAALSFTGASTAAADTSDFEFESFHADYTISANADGTSRLDVVETIVAVFPDFDQNRGIIRAIPDYQRMIPLDTQITSVVDERGDEVYFEVYPSGEFIELWLGDDNFAYGATTYVISYTQSNVVGSFDDTGADEFYWDVNGTGWAQPFGAVSTTINIGAEIAPALTGNIACYAGELNNTAACDSIERVDAADTGLATITAAHTGLNPYETLTVAIGFTPGTFVQGEPVSEEEYPGVLPGEGEPEEPIVYSDAPWWSNLLSGLIIAAGAGLSGLAIVRRVRGGDAPGRGVIIPQYSVPDDLNIMVAAHLVGESDAAVPAQLVSLAVRHKIRILDYPVTEGSDADYTLQFITAEGTDRLEKKILRALFGAKLTAGEVRELSDADTELGTAVAAVEAEARGEVTTTGLRATPSAAPWLFMLGAFGLLVVSIFGVGAMAIAVSISGWPFIGIAVAIVAIIVSAATIRVTGPLTEKGAHTREYLEGMKMYLELAEKDRFRMLQGPDTAERIDVGDTSQVIKLYEKLLPFAVLWGVEEQWMEELEVKVTTQGETPDWFVSTTGFNSHAFTITLRGVAAAATYTPPPAPSSSSSWSSGGGFNSSFGSSFGGSSGGGFSGGGGGGGGGGGR